MKKKQSIEELKKEGWVKTAAEIPVLDKGILAADLQITPEEIKDIFNRMKWHKEIEAYCGELGILPTDLIETHRQSLKMAAKKLKQGKELNLPADQSAKSNFRADLIKNKTGYTPK